MKVVTQGGLTISPYTSSTPISPLHEEVPLEGLTQVDLVEEEPIEGVFAEGLTQVDPVEEVPMEGLTHVDLVVPRHDIDSISEKGCCEKRDSDTTEAQ
ncbi:hypothetical protein F0562_005813 [Nyssa sinensis]|uniref:Uncharacterized protein n=1 Tax=Nyssa sinensis TaxID=561372 RepID=A0A5J5ALH7_9ASTE|nr:hypothetical protein F0562_005813 [Nyssa sinensis]